MLELIGRTNMPKASDLAAFFEQLSSSLESGLPNVKFQLSEANLERTEEGEVTVHELKEFGQLAAGDAVIMKLRITVGIVSEYTIYVRFDVTRGGELQYKGISLSGHSPFGIMSSKAERKLDPSYRSTIANIESWIETFILLPMQSLLTGRLNMV